MDPTKEAGAERHAGGAAVGHAVSHAAGNHDKKGESRIGRWEVGDVEITSIMETADRIPWAPLFPAET